LKIRARHARNGATMRSNQHALVLQRRQVTPDRRSRYLQPLAKIRGRHRALRRKNFADFESPFFSEHRGKENKTLYRKMNKARGNDLRTNKIVDKRAQSEYIRASDFLTGVLNEVDRRSPWDALLPVFDLQVLSAG